MLARQNRVKTQAQKTSMSLQKTQLLVVNGRGWLRQADLPPLMLGELLWEVLIGSTEVCCLLPGSSPEDGGLHKLMKG